MTPPLLAVIGCGEIARRHAAAAGRLRGRVALAFASREHARAARYARELGGVAAFGSYEAALDEPRVVGAIVCTPHDRHLSDVLLALERGRHVLVEKPIARTLEEADRMIDAARTAGRVLMVAENFRYMPAFVATRQAIDAGHVGEVRDVHLVARGFRARAGWRESLASMGGGALIDGGIHYVHNLRRWGGAVRRVFALSPPKTTPRMGGEDAVTVLAELDGGAVGLLACSSGNPVVSQLQWSTVTGTRGTCAADHRGRFTILRGPRGVRVRVFARDRRGHQAMLADFLRAVATGSPGAVDGLEGRRDLAVVLAVYRSLAERRPIEVSP